MANGEAKSSLIQYQHSHSACSVRAPEHLCFHFDSPCRITKLYEKRPGKGIQSPGTRDSSSADEEVLNFLHKSVRFLVPNYGFPKKVETSRARASNKSSFKWFKNERNYREFLRKLWENKTLMIKFSWRNKFSKVNFESSKAVLVLQMSWSLPS